mgnify:CR=1 FL=1
MDANSQLEATNQKVSIKRSQKLDLKIDTLPEKIKLKSFYEIKVSKMNFKFIKKISVIFVYSNSESLQQFRQIFLFYSALVMKMT